MTSPIERYLYRCTTDKLTMHIARIEESGDLVEWPVFTGGRDWVLICRKAETAGEVSVSHPGPLRHRIPGESA